LTLQVISQKDTTNSSWKQDSASNEWMHLMYKSQYNIG